MNMRLIWLTDIHLNFLSPQGIMEFGQTIKGKEPDAVVISGDISEAPILLEHLTLLVLQYQKPTYFVLGNHDFYRSSISKVRDRVRTLKKTLPWAHYLTTSEVIPLTEDTAIIGHDGWYDGLNGDYKNSSVTLADFDLIGDYAFLPRAGILKVMKELTEEAQVYLRGQLIEAIEMGFKNVLVVTHVPPFAKAGWHRGKLQDKDWAPFFSNKMVGTALRHVARQHPDREITVICGHTHGAGVYKPLPNMIVHTGGAIYKNPDICSIIELKGEAVLQKPGPANSTVFDPELL